MSMSEGKLDKSLEKKIEQITRQKGAVGWDSFLKPRIKNNRALKGTQVIRIYVEKKKPLKELKPFEILPTEVEGLEVDVVEVGYPKIPLPNLHSNSASKKQRKGKKFTIDPTGVVRPIVAGLSIGNMCFDDKTLLLTKDGFKGVNEINYDSEVATLNPKTGVLEWERPKNIFIYDYEGPMIHFESGHYDSLVTPEHRVYCRVTRGRKRFEFILAKDLVGRREFEFTKVAKWNCTPMQVFDAPKPAGYEEIMHDYEKVKELRTKGLGWRKISKVSGINGFSVKNWLEGGMPFRGWNIKDRIPANLWFEFMGWYLSEGCIGRSRNNLSLHKVIISQKDPENRKRIIWLIKKMGFKPFESGRNIGFNSTQLAQYLKQFGHAHEKYVPQYIKDAPPKQIRIFLEALFRGDGSFIRGTYSKRYAKKWHGKWFCYYTTSKRLAEDVCELLLKVGLSFHLVKTLRKKWRPLYKVFVINKYLTPRAEKPPKVENYKGKVWCVETKNGIVFAIRNGKGIWTGNSITTGTSASYFYAPKSTEVRISSNGHVFTKDCLKPPEYQPKEILQPGPYHQNNPANLAAFLEWYNQLEPESQSSCPVMNSLASGINAVAKAVGAKSRMVVMVDTSNNDIDFAVGIPQVPYEYKVLENPLSGKKLVGLIFAGSDTISIFCKISNIMKRGYTPVVEEPMDAEVGDEVEGWSWRLDGYHGSFKVSSTSANFLVDYGTGKVLMRDVAWGGKMALPGTSGTPLYLKGEQH